MPIRGSKWNQNINSLTSTGSRDALMWNTDNKKIIKPQHPSYTEIHLSSDHVERDGLAKGLLQRSCKIWWSFHLPPVLFHMKEDEGFNSWAVALKSAQHAAGSKAVSGTFPWHFFPSWGLFLSERSFSWSWWKGSLFVVTDRRFSEAVLSKTIWELRTSLLMTKYSFSVLKA